MRRKRIPLEESWLQLGPHGVRPDRATAGPDADASAPQGVVPWVGPASRVEVPSGERESSNTLQNYLCWGSVRRFSQCNRNSKSPLARSSGDFEVRQRLIEHHLRLVVSIAKNYVGRGVPLPDLIEKGNLGLMHAIGKFEPECGFRLSTYSSW